MSGDFSLRLLDDEATRQEHGKTVWLLERDGAQLGQIVHQHSAERREKLARGAWFTVRVHHDDVPVHSRDFGDALKRVAELLASPVPAARAKAKRNKKAVSCG